MGTVLAERQLPTGQILQIVSGDLTAETTDAIVNAANAHLQHGGGIAGAIVRRGGGIIQEESDIWVREHGPVQHARPAWTSAGSLPARYVIHAVGPVWGDGNEDAKLSAAITGSLHVADDLGLGSISIPAISTGIFGFPKDRAAGVIFTAMREYFLRGASRLKTVRLVLFDEPTIQAFMSAWRAALDYEKER
jgi:O-acetyl-ADP-ribose deacetylase